MVSAKPTGPIPVVWSQQCLRHEPGGEVWLGVREPGTELPERARVILAALRAAGADVVPAAAHGDEALMAVHDRLVPALRGSCRRAWQLRRRGREPQPAAGPGN